MDESETKERRGSSTNQREASDCRSVCGKREAQRKQRSDEMEKRFPICCVSFFPSVRQKLIEVTLFF